jgi:lipoate-protein ligase A
MIEKYMAGLRVFFAEEHDPWLNLATEDWLFREMAPDQHVLYLWRNASTVVIGRYQNPWNECNLQAMERDGVKLSRRQSGGGAVFHDLGNTNFTFMSGRNSYSRDRNNQIIIQALQKFGISAEASGRNDIVVDGRKISGSAFKLTAEKAFHHGTLLIDADLTRLPQYLTPDKRKLAAKGIKSIKSRVANLSEFSPVINHDMLCHEIIQEFFSVYGEECPVELLDYASLTTIPHLADYFKLMSDWNWRFGKTPDFNHEMHTRFDWGGLEVHIEAGKGHIQDVKIFSDCLKPELIERLQPVLIGLPYEGTAVRNRVLQLTEELPDCTEEIEEAAAWLEREIQS